MRGYCDFYEVNPSDEELLALSSELIASLELDGVQLIARDDKGRAIGFATILWTWSTLSASRIAVMNDLFVSPDGAGSGAADALIDAVPSGPASTAPPLSTGRRRATTSARGRSTTASAARSTTAGSTTAWAPRS